MTVDEIFAGIRESIDNARPDVKLTQQQVLSELATGITRRHVEMTMAALERLDIVDHYPAVRRADGTLEPQPMPGGWTSWYGWMRHLRAFEEAAYLADRQTAATADIPETGRR